MTPELIEATNLLGQTGLSPPTFTEHDRSWLSKLKKQKAEETEQGRESD